MIPVTKPFLPPKKLLFSHLSEVYERNWLTNHGPLVTEFEQKIMALLNHNNMKYVTNGTLALQIALQALGKKGEVVTTPYSYIATTSSIIWEGNTPIFVDVNNATGNISPALIDEKISQNTIAILATHVYGNPCDIDEIENISKRHNIPVIYDAAHCFGTLYKGKSIFHFGDIVISSFHATKIMHTVEGGAVFSNRKKYHRPIEGLMNFGHTSENTFDMAGINGKNSEFHAAMGLSVLPFFTDILAKRREQWEMYKNKLISESKLSTIIINPLSTYNYAYFPLIFQTEELLIDVKNTLFSNKITARRYFSPSLNELPFLPKASCPNSESISKRVLCLPLYNDLTTQDQNLIIDIILNTLTKHTNTN
ncbi:MAG: DegT/DnrJ/EryC1/StrS family aminotransferase [Flavobacteriales bacterium]|jgi:dTDP-4-amino-4,6-dideoxygalactose transaminase|nr:DegT/DnrJ/EryC1/StrS family aminotransferase [Crocinitomicaceae bacterium]MDG2332536.1 DegT/DnrJ/EryC1/StrS family aminotransferase [Flavobacteriales bacterium]